MSYLNEIEESESLNLQFEKREGLIPVVVQDIDTLEILMLAYTNREAFNYTVKHRIGAFWSTSRKELWVKGNSSGNVLHVKEIRVDCDQDALVYLAKLEGSGVCHTKNCKNEFRTSCFYRSLSLTENNVEKLTFLEK